MPGRLHRTSTRHLLARRGGFTLIELLLTVTTISLVLSSAAFVMHAMFRVDRQMRDDLTYSVLLPRLSVQLREDVHAAHSAAVSVDQDELSLLTLQQPEGRMVRYDAGESRIVRVVRRDEEQLHREVYDLKATRVRWDLDEAAGFLRVRIERDVGKIKDANDSRYLDIIEAAIGLNHFQQDMAAKDSSAENNSSGAG